MGKIHKGKFDEIKEVKKVKINAKLEEEHLSDSEFNSHQSIYTSKEILSGIYPMGSKTDQDGNEEEHEKEVFEKQNANEISEEKFKKSLRTTDVKKEIIIEIENLSEKQSTRKSISEYDQEDDLLVESPLSEYKGSVEVSENRRKCDLRENGLQEVEETQESHLIDDLSEMRVSETEEEGNGERVSIDKYIEGVRQQLIGTDDNRIQNTIQSLHLERKENKSRSFEIENVLKINHFNQENSKKLKKNKSKNNKIIFTQDISKLQFK